MVLMLKRLKQTTRYWNEVPALIFIGTLLVLTPIFAYITVNNIRSQEKHTETLLTEKGEALIRSFEASTRSGLLDGPGDTRQLQKLLYETAQQPDIEYLLVADTNGTIIAHSNYMYTGVMLNLFSNNKKLDLEKIADSNALFKQIVVSPEGKRTFVVFRRFSPSGPPQFGSVISFFSHTMSKRRLLNLASPDRIIVVGLDMKSMDEVRKIYFKNAIITGLVLLLTGISGIIFLFMFQGYRITRNALSKIRVFSNAVVENMPVGLIAMDNTKTIVSLNHAAKSILALDQNTNGNHPLTILPPEMRDKVEELGASGDLIENEIECTLQDGRRVPLEISAAVLRDQENDFSGTICLFKDLSNEKALQSQVERSHRLATVGQLAAGVAHEVRNPLSSIKGFATYFKERYRDIPEDQQISDIMIKEVDRLNRVVGQLLEFARPVAIHRRDVVLKNFIEDSLKLVERKAGEAGIQLCVHMDIEVKSWTLDPDRISQVLLNLYLNAIEAMEQGGILTVSVIHPHGKDEIEICVEDTGTGIDTRNIAHIFDPYFTTKSSGTGLGLAISHNIIKAHKGEIRIENRAEKGASITITLPSGKENDEHENTLPACC
jgi:two-component system sensor histidine kinase HydH